MIIIFILYTFGNSVSSANVLAWSQRIWNSSRNFEQRQLQHKSCYGQNIAKNTHYHLVKLLDMKHLIVSVKESLKSNGFSMALRRIC